MLGNCTAETANQYYFLLINLIDSAVQMATWFMPKTKKFNPPVIKLIKMSQDIKSVFQGL